MMRQLLVNLTPEDEQRLADIRASRAARGAFCASDEVLADIAVGVGLQSAIELERRMSSLAAKESA